MVQNMRRGGFLITKIHQAAGRILTKKLKNYSMDEINPAQGRLLFYLWNNDNIPIQELAEKTSLRKSTLTSMLDRLEEGDYIRRVHCPEDRRKYLIEVQPRGESLQKIYTKVIEEMADLFYEGFTENEVEQCEEYLKRIFENLTRAEQEYL